MYQQSWEGVTWGSSPVFSTIRLTGIEAGVFREHVLVPDPTFFDVPDQYYNTPITDNFSVEIHLFLLVTWLREINDEKLTHLGSVQEQKITETKQRRDRNHPLRAPTLGQNSIYA